MLRTFEGPEAPRAHAPRRRGYRSMLAAAAAVIVFGTAAVAAALLVGGGATREAALPRSGPCDELRLEGRRYVARGVGGGVLARSGAFHGRAVLLCRDRVVRGASVVGIAGVDPATAVRRPAAPGVVYVAAGACRRARTDDDLAACLRRSGAR